MTTPVSSVEFYKGQTIRVVASFVTQDEEAFDPDAVVGAVIKPDGEEEAITLEPFVDPVVVGSYEGFITAVLSGRYLIRVKGTITATSRHAVQIGELYVQRDPFVAT